MEEILASIRRIIADDEAKPAAAEKSATPAPPPKPESPKAAVAKPAQPPAAPPQAKAPVMSNIPPSAIPAAQAAAAKAAPPKPAPPPMPAPAASNSQDDIDAMLAGLDAATDEPEVRAPPPPPALKPEPEPDVFDLTDDMAVAMAAPPKNSFRTVAPENDLEFAEARAAPKPRQQPAYEPPPFESSGPPILSHSTVSAVESAFHSLANTVLSNNARTLEDLVKEMLRPMLKSWLDDNLPGLVERIVKQEIERVSRGGR
jgi:hypothetical protein